jgi:hypothetical protein
MRETIAHLDPNCLFFQNITSNKCVEYIVKIPTGWVGLGVRGAKWERGVVVGNGDRVRLGGRRGRSG